MGRFISNFEIYSKRSPEKFILVILPGDEERNIKSLSDTPFWDHPPKWPEAINEITAFINNIYFFDSLKNYKKDMNLENVIPKNNKLKILQKKLVWNELKYHLEYSQYPINLVITPPKKWFQDKENLKEINFYNKLLKEFAKLRNIEKTCNLYEYILPEYNASLYVDGVHLSKKGHELWAKKIKDCFKYNS